MEFRNSKLLAIWDRFLVHIAIGFEAIFLLAYLVAHRLSSSSQFILTVKDLLLSLIPELMAVFLLFIFSYLFLRQVKNIEFEEKTDVLISKFSDRVIDALKQSHFLRESTPSVELITKFNDVSWDRLIANSLQMDIIVHYFHSWIRNNNLSIKKFFDNGGKIRIVLPNRDNEQMIQTINGRLPDHNIDSIKENITNTVLLLNRIKEESTNAQALVETTFTNEMIWY